MDLGKIIRNKGQDNPDEDLYFTIYWLGGSRNVVHGKSIEDAFTRAGYGGGAVNAIDWYDNGISETHWYDKDAKEWKKYEPKVVFGPDFGMDKPNAPQEIETILKNHRSLILILPNKDQYSISYEYGCFAGIGWVYYIHIVFGKYHQGSYGGSEDDDEFSHHFMACASEYFDVEHPAVAIAAFINRYKEPFKASNKGFSLDEIKARQVNLWD